MRVDRIDAALHGLVLRIQRGLDGRPPLIEIRLCEGQRPLLCGPGPYPTVGDVQDVAVHRNAHADSVAKTPRRVGREVQLVSGYPGTNDVVLAMERGEVDGLCGLSWSTITTRHAEWLTNHSANIIVQAALKKEPEIAAVPLATDLVKNPEQLQIIKLLLASQAMARPFAAPPDIPAYRKATLIAAFDATMRDADFLGEAAKLNFEIHPVTASTIDALLAEVYATPKDVLTRAAKAISSASQ